ncbi:MAG: hypothetical protein ACKPKO_05040, partial [Candidatus Fonsibacter sp.]
MANWQITIGLNCVCVGGFSDELEVAWLAECSTKTFDELSASSWRTMSFNNPNNNIGRRRKVDYALARGLHIMLRQSKEASTEDVVLKAREISKANAKLKR